MPAPACYDVRISHHRRVGVDYRFAHRSRTWLVDLDDLAILPRGVRGLCRFDARDHLGDPRRSIRANLDQWLAGKNVERPVRVLLLANPRVLGYVFNPLSVFYCYDEQSRLSHVVAEVCNTYGGRHAYLLTPDSDGRADADKVFYVSPFNPVEGRYELRVPEPGARISVAVTLHRPAAAAFTAAMTGTRRPRASLWSALRSPLATRAVMARVRWHGIRLYLKGLRPQPRERATS